MEAKTEYALELLPRALAEKISHHPKINSADEIRLRRGRRASLTVSGSDILLDVTASPSDIEETFKNAFSYSIHSFQRELCGGCITSRGGNRVGVCGTAVTTPDGRLESVKSKSSINIRIAREVKGCAEALSEACFKTGPVGVLVTGAPSSGKTTLLRDISRILGSKYRTALIDERGELSAAYCGAPQNDVGELTDVFFGYPKAEGIDIAVRVMSPRALIVDEISLTGETKALMSALGSGVEIITAVHAPSFSEAQKKPAISALLERGAFGYAAELNRDRTYRVIKID